MLRRGAAGFAVLALLGAGCSRTTSLGHSSRDLGGAGGSDAGGGSAIGGHATAGAGAGGALHCSNEGRTFPTAETTGVPAGTTLTLHQGDLSVDTPGAIVENLELIDGCLLVTADDVTVRSSRFRAAAPCATRGHIVLDEEDVGGLRVEDVEIDGMGDVRGTAIRGSNLVLRRVHIHSMGTALQVGSNVLVEDSLIESGTSTDPYTGIQSTGGVGLTVRHCSIDMRDGRTAAVFLKTDFGSIADVLVQDSWLDGGGYTAEVVPVEPYTVTGVRFLDNVLGRTASYGPRELEAAVEWECNVWADTGEIVPREP